MFYKWSEKIANKLAAETDPYDFDQWWLKILVQLVVLALLIKLAWMSVFYLGLGCGYVLKFYHIYIAPLVQGLLHFFGGKA